MQLTQNKKEKKEINNPRKIKINYKAIMNNFMTTNCTTKVKQKTLRKKLSKLRKK